MIVIFIKASGIIPASVFFQQPLRYAVNSLFLQKIRKSGYYGNNKSNIGEMDGGAKAPSPLRQTSADGACYVN